MRLDPRIYVNAQHQASAQGRADGRFRRRVRGEGSDAAKGLEEDFIGWSPNKSRIGGGVSIYLGFLAHH